MLSIIEVHADHTVRVASRSIVEPSRSIEHGRSYFGGQFKYLPLYQVVRLR